MPSLLPHYEYDIFISYRHKDNKGDHWVSEFVAALKTELEATFKEDISIYFDENPHDGLLETHNVDKSLEGKLKCLIFIPIISQTYCDPKSFAWQYEFCAFNKLAREDQFGRDITLSNGNVASRILPIKIHDLDSTDKILVENELGTTLRSIEFIYKSSGVNRSLTSSDSPEKNLHKTFYRDQINKVANSVKEIMAGLKNFENHSSPPVSKTLDQAPIKIEFSKILRVTSIAILLVLISGYLLLNVVRIIGLPYGEQLPLHKLIFPILILAVVAIVGRQPIRKMGFTLLQIASISVFAGGLADILFTFTSSSVPDQYIKFLQITSGNVPDNLVSLEFALLRTLGTSLLAVGIGTWVLLHSFIKHGSKTALYAVIIMITLTEGNNTFQMYTLSLPFYIYTFTIVLLTWIGAVLWWKGDPNLLPRQ